MTPPGLEAAIADLYAKLGNLRARVERTEKALARAHRRLAALEPMDNLCDPGAGNGRDHVAQ